MTLEIDDFTTYTIKRAVLGVAKQDGRVILSIAEYKEYIGHTEVVQDEPSEHIKGDLAYDKLAEILEELQKPTEEQQ